MLFISRTLTVQYRKCFVLNSTLHNSVKSVQKKKQNTVIITTMHVRVNSINYELRKRVLQIYAQFHFI